MGGERERSHGYGGQADARSWGSLQGPYWQCRGTVATERVSRQRGKGACHLSARPHKKAGTELPPPPPLTPGQYQSRSDPRLPSLYAPTQMFPTRSRSPGLPSSYHTQQDYLPYPPGCRLDLRPASWYHPINHLIPPHNHRSPPCTPARRKDGWCRRCRPRQGKRLNPPRTLPLAAQAWEGD